MKSACTSFIFSVELLCLPLLTMAMSQSRIIHHTTKANVTDQLGFLSHLVGDYGHTRPVLNVVLSQHRSQLRPPDSTLLHFTLSDSILFLVIAFRNLELITMSACCDAPKFERQLILRANKVFGQCN